MPDFMAFFPFIIPIDILVGADGKEITQRHGSCISEQVGKSEQKYCQNRQAGIESTACAGKPCNDGKRGHNTITPSVHNFTQVGRKR